MAPLASITWPVTQLPARRDQKLGPAMRLLSSTVADLIE
jgi:hypothetical protein